MVELVNRRIYYDIEREVLGYEGIELKEDVGVGWVADGLWRKGLRVLVEDLWDLDLFKLRVINGIFDIW